MISASILTYFQLIATSHVINMGKYLRRLYIYDIFYVNVSIFIHLFRFYFVAEYLHITHICYQNVGHKRPTIYENHNCKRSEVSVSERAEQALPD